MSKVIRGLIHGAIYAVVFCTLTLMLTPAFNILLVIVLVAGVVLAFGIGIVTNLHSSDLTCDRCGRTFRAMFGIGKCPDCGWSRKDSSPR